MAAQLTDQLVMPILVEVDPERSTHLHAIEQVALATRLAVLELDRRRDAQLAEWLASGMRKTVRKAKAGSLGKRLADLATSGSDDAALISHPVLIDDLKRYDQFTPLERRAQVSGWDLSSRDDSLRSQISDAVEPGWLVIHVDADLSTGKAAAAAAHITTLLALDERAQHSSFVLRLRSDVLADVQHRDVLHVIHDAGHTEVETGHVTAACTAA